MLKSQLHKLFQFAHCPGEFAVFVDAGEHPPGVDNIGSYILLYLDPEPKALQYLLEHSHVALRVEVVANHCVPALAQVLLHVPQYLYHVDLQLVLLVLSTAVEEDEDVLGLGVLLLPRIVTALQIDFL